MTINEWFVQELNKNLEDYSTKLFINRSWFYEGKEYTKNDTKLFWRWLFKEIVSKPSFQDGLKLNQESIKEELENKTITIKDYNSWQARQKGRTQLYHLTAKGVDQLVKTYNLEYNK